MRALLLCVTLAAPAFAQGRTPRDTTPFQIAALRAYLFHEERGTFDTTDLAALGDAGGLFNVTIGGGLAHGSPSNAMLVLVELTGPFRYDSTGRHSPFAQDTTGVLQLTAQVESKVLLQRGVRLRSLFSEQGQVWVPFVVYGTGCGPLTLAAKMLHTGLPDAVLSKTIHFQCGE